MRTLFFAMSVLFSLLLVACSPTAAPPAAPTPALEAAPTTEPAAPTTEPAQPAQADNPLVGTAWQWVGLVDPLQEVTIEDPASYTLTFSDATSFSIRADCNNATGSYTASDGTLSIMLGATTLAACPDDSRSDQFLQNLGFVANYFFEGDRLFMDMMADGGTLEFAPLE